MKPTSIRLSAPALVALALFSPANARAEQPGSPAKGLFSGSKIEVPSLALNKSVPLLDDKPELNAGKRGFGHRRPTSIPSIRELDTKSVISPKPGIDYKLLVKTPDPHVDYKILAREVTGPAPPQK